MVSSAQLVGETTPFLVAINFACLALGVVVALAIIPSMLRGNTKPQQTTKQN